MSTQIQRRRGTTAQHASFTGAIGETTIDTDKEVVVVHDGSTVGGNPLMREDASNSALALGSAAAPSLKFTGDTNTGIYSPGADQVAISTNGTGRLFVDSAGKVGVGASPTQLLQLGAFGGNDSNLQFAANTAGASNILFGDGSSGADFYRGFIKYNHATDSLELFASSYSTITTNGSERCRIDSSGRLLVGTSTARSDFFGAAPDIQLERTADRARLMLCSNSNNVQASELILSKTRGTTAGSATVVQQNDELGNIHFAGTDGTDFALGASIKAYVDGTPGANDMPGRLVFSTTSDGAASPTERLRIDSSGRVGIGTSSPPAALTVVGSAGSGDAGINIASGSTTIGSKAALFFIPSSSPSVTTGSAIKCERLSPDGSDLQFFTVSALGNTPVRAMTIDSSQRVGIGTTSVTAGNLLDVRGRIESRNDSASEYAFYARGNYASGGEGGIRHAAGLLDLRTAGAYALTFSTNNSEVGRFDTSGRLLVGTSTAAATYVSLGLQGNGSVATNQATLAMARGSNPSGDSQELGRIEFFNNNSNSGGTIVALSEGAWTTGSSHPTRLAFSTTADGAS
jgi:hypothetical protein